MVWVLLWYLSHLSSLWSKHSTKIMESFASHNSLSGLVLALRSSTKNFQTYTSTSFKMRKVSQNTSTCQDTLTCEERALMSPGFSWLLGTSRVSEARRVRNTGSLVPNSCKTTTPSIISKKSRLAWSSLLLLRDSVEKKLMKLHLSKLVSETQLIKLIWSMPRTTAIFTHERVR